MLKILRIVLSIITISLLGFSLITENFDYIPYLMLSLGATMLVIGLIELQKKQKRLLGIYEYCCIIICFLSCHKGIPLCINGCLRVRKGEKII